MKTERILFPAHDPLSTLAFVLAIFSGVVPSRAALADRTIITTPAQASPLETFAAREVQRYVYLRTGRLLSIGESDSALPSRNNLIVVARKDRAIVAGSATEPLLRSNLAGLSAESYWLRTVDETGRRVLFVTGGGDLGTLYGAYRLAEHLGLRFYLHGDEVPAERTDFVLPALDEVKKPLFRLRGIQPFHDFPEGPDWWNEDDYLAIISQLPKLRMNFFGLHTYPEGAPNAEPTVWIGPASEVGEGGQVKASYPSSYQNTLRGNWGNDAKKTSEFSFGSDALFDRDDYGPEVMRGACPQPASPEACNAVFERTAAMLRMAFRHAHELGVKTCVGTETALTIPKQVQDRLRAEGKDPGSAAVLDEIYQGIFTRDARAYDLDYYWFWTPEGWTWEATKDDQVKRTIDDLLIAIGAAKKVGAPFQLATCGWVLGPHQDRALFDKVLPKEVAVSCINREVGRTPVDNGFARVSGRGKWAIPWLEDDPALTAPQLWVGRMRRDAADALRYGCDGLMGIHWRTRVLSPNISALAQAAWEQGSWTTADLAPRAAPEQVYPPTDDFYRDWAVAQFGKDAGFKAATILAKMDGRLPRPSDWVNGPGGLKPDSRPWGKVQEEYAFVKELEALTGAVKAADRPRFNYWLDTFEYLRAIAHVDCTWALCNQAMDKVRAEKESLAQRQLARQLALPLRRELIENVGDVYRHLLALVSNSGELGTIANWEQHLLPDLLTKPGAELTTLLGEALPEDALVPKRYSGPVRVILPTIRSSVGAGEGLTLKVIVLSQDRPRQAVVQWRPLGPGPFKQLPLAHQARGVFSVQLPPETAQGAAFEYCVKVIASDGQPVYFPETAPILNQTVVVFPDGKSKQAAL